MNMKYNNKYPTTFYEAIRLLLIFFLIQLVITWSYTEIHSIITNKDYIYVFMNMSNFDILLYAFSLTIIQYLLLFIYVNRIHNIQLSDIISFSGFPVNILLPLIPIIIGIYIFSSEIKNIINYYIPIPELLSQIRPDIRKIRFINGSINFIISPLFEEIMFRGMILNGLISRYKPSKAILFSSFLFALFHVNPFRYINTFIWGVFFGYLFFKTRSLFLCVLTHMLVNILGSCFILLPEIPGFNSRIPSHSFQPLWLTLTGVTLFCAGLWILVKYFNRQDSIRKKIVEKIPQEAI